MKFRFAMIASAVATLGLAAQAQAAQFSAYTGPGFSSASVIATPFGSGDLFVDVTGVTTNGLELNAANTVRYYAVAPGALVDAISYSLTQTAYSPSWLSEMVVSFTTSTGDGVFLTAGYADSTPGTASYTDSALLSDYGLAFTIPADGLLRVEFFETFDDSSVNPDGLFVSGGVTLAGIVPEPSTYGMMALGLLGLGAALRRRQAAR